MSTWTCKGPGLAAVLLTLGACSDTGGFTVAGLGLGSGAASAKALRSAPLAQGAVTLVAPDGFCIDPRSLSRSFALIARCDTLGAGLNRTDPLVIITAATSAGPAPGADRLATASETVLRPPQTSADGATLVQLQATTPPADQLAPTYWRAAMDIGDQALGLALYTDARSTDPVAAAPALLMQTLERSAARSAQPAGNSATTPEKPPRSGLLARLFP